METDNTVTDQCWCGYSSDEHTMEMRRWAAENDQLSPCMYFTRWPETD